MSDIKTPVLEMTAKIKPLLTVEGGVTATPKDLFVSTLPEGLTLDTVKAVDQHRTTFNAGYMNAVGQLAHEALTADKSLDKVTAKVELNKDVLQVAVLREETRPDPQKPGKTVTRVGVIKPNYKAYAGRADVGQAAAVRVSVRNLFSGISD